MTQVGVHCAHHSYALVMLVEAGAAVELAVVMVVQDIILSQASYGFSLPHR